MYVYVYIYIYAYACTCMYINTRMLCICCVYTAYACLSHYEILILDMCTCWLTYD